MAFIDAVQVPDASELRVQLEQLVRVGEITPAQAQTILQEQTAYDQIRTDPRLRQAQLGALSTLQGTIDEGGLDARGRASLEDALSTQRTTSRGLQDAILANTRARGIGGSDIETVARLVGNQAAATQGSRAALDTAALREQRRDQAIRDVGSLSSQIRGQDFGEDERRAQAADAINRFNAANRQSQENIRIGDINRAQAGNLAAEQAISDANVGIRNRQEFYNKGIPLDLYEIQAGRARERDERERREDAEDDARRSSNIGTAGAIIGTLASAFSDERLKTNVQPLDSRRILGELTGSTWEYEDPAMGPGVHAGPMAQDLERTPLAGAVQDTPAGKVVDYGAMGFDDAGEGGMTMALLADINRRLERLGG